MRSLGVTARVCVLAGATSCGPSIPQDRALPGVSNDVAVATLPASNLSVLRGADRPTLQLIRRKGDPRGAVSFSVFTPHGSQGSVLLGALLEHRLAEMREGKRFSFALHSLGVIFSIEVTSGDDALKVSEGIYRALSQPVREKELDNIDEIGALAAASRRSQEASPVESCLARLGSEPRNELVDRLKRSQVEKRLARLEELRSASFVASRIGISAVGSRTVTGAVTAIQKKKWPSGAPLIDAWAGSTEVAVRPGPGSRELLVALRVPDPGAALSAGRRIGDDSHPLRARLSGISPELSIEDVDVTLRPAGACIALRLNLPTDGKLVSKNFISAAASVTTEELRSVVLQPPRSDERKLALLTPQGALEAAGLASWTAVRSATTGTNLKSIVEYRTPDSSSLGESELARVLRQTRAQWATRTLPIVVSDEMGQAELYLGLASSCGVGTEPASQSGLRALTVRALAQQFSGQDGVTLHPWYGKTAVGLIGHSSPREGESAEELARRVARALGASLEGTPMDGRIVAESRQRQLEKLGDDPARTLLRSILAGDNPSLLEPLGNEKSVSPLSTMAVERVRGDIVREPLRIALLQNMAETQSQAAQSALSGWLAHSREHTEKCSKTPSFAAPPGEWTLETTDDAMTPSLLIGLPISAPREVGRSLAYYLNSPNGPLNRALLRPGLAAHAEATWSGDGNPGSLMIAIGSTPEQSENALNQVRAILDRLSSNSLEPSAFRELEKRQREEEALAERHPISRLTRVWSGGGRTEITEKGLNAALAQLEAKNHRVVRLTARN